MIYQMTRKIFDAFRKTKGLMPYLIEKKDSSAVEVILKHKSGVYPIHFISTSEQNDVAVRCDQLIAVDEDEILAILPTINTLNADYRFTRFYCNYRGEICVAHDYFMSDEAPEESAAELLEYMQSIIRRAYPILRKAIDEIRGMTEVDKKRDVIAEIAEELKEGGYQSHPLDKSVLDPRGVGLKMKIDGDCREIRFFINLADRLEMCLNGIMHVSDHQRGLIGPLMENLNIRRDGLEILCDEEGEINIRFDYPRTVTDPASSVCDMVECVVAAVQDVAPKLKATLAGFSSAENFDVDVQIECRKKIVPVEQPVDSDQAQAPVQERIMQELKAHGFDPIVWNDSDTATSLVLEDMFRNSQGIITIDEEQGRIKLYVPRVMHVEEKAHHDWFRLLLKDMEERYRGLEFGMAYQGDIWISAWHCCAEYEYGPEGMACAWVREMIDAGLALRAEVERRLMLTSDEGTHSPVMKRIRGELERRGYACAESSQESGADAIELEVPVSGQDRKLTVERCSDDGVSISLIAAFRVGAENLRLFVQTQVEACSGNGADWSVSFDERGWATLRVDIACNEDDAADRVLMGVREAAEKAKELHAAIVQERRKARIERETAVWTLEDVKAELERHGYSCELKNLQDGVYRKLEVEVEIEGKRKTLNFFVWLDGSLSIRMYYLLKTRQNQKAQVRDVLEKLNDDLDGMKALCDGDGYIDLRYDFPVGERSPVACAADVVQRCIDAAVMVHGEVRKALGDDLPPEWSIGDIQQKLVSCGYECELEELVDEEKIAMTTVYTDVGIRYVSFVRMPDGLTASMLRIISDLDVSQCELIRPMLETLNSQYNDVEFECDEDGDVNIIYLYPENHDDPVSSAPEMVQHIIDIVNDVTPGLCEALVEADEESSGPQEGARKTSARKMQDIREELEAYGGICSREEESIAGVTSMVMSIACDGEDHEVVFVQSDEEPITMIMHGVVTGLDKQQCKEIGPALHRANVLLGMSEAVCNEYDGSIFLTYELCDIEGLHADSAYEMVQILAAEAQVVRRQITAWLNGDELL